MTILGASLKLVMFFSINSAALRLLSKTPPNSDTQFIALKSNCFMDYDGISLAKDQYHTRQCGWRVRPAHGMKSLGLLHIPKTAGTSFTLDAPRLLPSGMGLFSAEASLGWMEKVTGVDEIVTFVRHPTGHVYSQFLELADDAWGKSVLKDRSKVVSVTHWLEQFFDGDSIKTDDFGGYHPFNMLARSFINSEREPSQYDNHHYHTVDTKEAISIMKKVKFVGITEYYHESMCLFFDKVQPAEAMPDWCDCKSPEWSQFSAHMTKKTTTDKSHGVRLHSLKDLSERDLEMIVKLTEKDEVLYKESLNRFFHEIDELENRKQANLSCAWKK